MAFGTRVPKQWIIGHLGYGIKVLEVLALSLLEPSGRSPEFSPQILNPIALKAPKPLKAFGDLKNYKFGAILHILVLAKAGVWTKSPLKGTGIPWPPVLGLQSPTCVADSPESKPGSKKVVHLHLGRFYQLHYTCSVALKVTSLRGIPHIPLEVP